MFPTADGWDEGYGEGTSSVLGAAKMPYKLIDTVRPATYSWRHRFGQLRPDFSAQRRCICHPLTRNVICFTLCPCVGC